MGMGPKYDKDRALKRISLLIGEDQYDVLAKEGLNLSWLVRELIDNHLSDKKIVIDVGADTLGLYQKIVTATGVLDSEFEPFFKQALHTFLKVKIENMQKLERVAFKKSEGSKK